MNNVGAIHFYRFIFVAAAGASPRPTRFNKQIKNAVMKHCSVMNE